MPENETWYKCSRGMWIGRADQLSASRACPFCASEVLVTDINRHWTDVYLAEQGRYGWPRYKKTPMPADWSPRPHPGMKVMWEWAVQQQKCFNSIAHLRNAYKVATGNFVDTEP